MVIEQRSIHAHASRSRMHQRTNQHRNRKVGIMDTHEQVETRSTATNTSTTMTTRRIQKMVPLCVLIVACGESGAFAPPAVRTAPAAAGGMTNTTPRRSRALFGPKTNFASKNGRKFGGVLSRDESISSPLSSSEFDMWTSSSPTGCGKCAVNSHLHSARDWLHNMRTLPQSTVMREIRNPVLTIAMWSTAVSVIHRLLMGFGRTGIAQKICISSSPHSFLVSALGLLLVFRTNSAYQRFVEGRRIWEGILSTSRNFSRFLSLYEKDISPERKYRVQKLLVAFPYLLRHHIRPSCLQPSKELRVSGSELLLHEPPLPAVQTRHEGDKMVSKKHYKNPRQCWVDRRNLPWNLFRPSSLEQLAVAKNRPLWVCDRMAKELASVEYSPNFTSRERLSLLGYVEKLTNAIGECERIHQTAVPLNYARHSLRSLTIWLFTLPFALIKDLGMLTGPAMGVVAWLLFGVYQIGYSIEDPFQGSIRLTALCDGIRSDVLGDADIRDTAFGLNADAEIALPTGQGPQLELIDEARTTGIPIFDEKLPLEGIEEAVSRVLADSPQPSIKNDTWG